jgi:hypothetical protein
MYGLHTPIPDGSIHRILWDDEVIEINLPPVGFTIDRIPDPDSGRASHQIVPCEILFSDLPIEDQKWKRSELPKDWKLWRRDEKENQRQDSNYVNPNADRFRQQEWIRKINGVWICLGNREGRPTEYIYLTGQAYDYFNWWKQEFGYPRFRPSLMKEFYCIQFCKDHPLLHGLVESTNRRRGKTAISMHNLWYGTSWKKNRKGGMQAQKIKDAKDKFIESFVYGFKHQPDFFRPVWDYRSGVKTGIRFNSPMIRTKEGVEIWEEDQMDNELNSMVDFRETISTAYDGYKLHEYSMEEPGKWENEDVYKTLNVIIPSTREGFEKIGFIYAPTTIEELNAGGANFIQMFEDSKPSLMKKNKNGKTTSGLLGLFIPAVEGIVFDEYGRAVIEDPKPDQIVIDEEGKRIYKGAMTQIKEEREPKKGNVQQFTEVVRKYPLSWSEAKMMDTKESPFNVMILQNRLDELDKLNRDLFIKGNFEWKDKKDGDVIFVRDDLNGRFNLHYWPDAEGEYVDGDKRITNRVGSEVFDGKKIWMPRNNRMFRMGSDPIRWTKTDDPRASKASLYVWRMYDPSVDMGKKQSEWKSHNFICEYLFRPNEFEIFGEDTIKCMRYFGCSIQPEDNVNNLRQYLEQRGYGNFVLFKGDYDPTVISQGENDAWKSLTAVEQNVSAGVQWLVSFFENHGRRVVFPNLLKQAIGFSIKERTKYDAVMGALWTGIATMATVTDISEETVFDLEEIFPTYNQEGERSRYN